MLEFNQKTLKTVRKKRKEKENMQFTNKLHQNPILCILGKFHLRQKHAVMHHNNSNINMHQPAFMGKEY